MILVWAGLAAHAGAVAVVPRDGSLHPGLPATLEIAATDDLGLPAPAPPMVTFTGAVPTGDPRAARPGVFVVDVVPDVGAAAVVVDADVFGERTSVSLPITPVPASHLAVPARVDALAGDADVVVRVTAADGDLPPPDAVDVVLAEGTVTAVTLVAGALEIRIRTEPATTPRVVPVGIRDRRRDEPPAWTGLRLRTRGEYRFATGEQGTKLVVTIGRRTYGPFYADERGDLAFSLEQFPGESTAQAVFSDDLGNETRSVLPLASQSQASLVALADGGLVPGRPAPRLYVHALHGDGHPWEGAPPRCATGAGPLSLVAIGAGVWAAPLGGGEYRQDLRVTCAIGAAAEARALVPVARSVPVRLDLRVWPEELTNDFPVATVQAILEDALGDRMPADGVVITADRGEIRMQPPDGPVARGEYIGTNAIATRGDALRARWHLPPGTGAPAFLDVLPGELPPGGTGDVWVRVLDDRGLPLVGASVAVSAGGAAVAAITDARGFAKAAVPLPDGMAPVVIEAVSGSRVARALVPRNQRAAVVPEADLAVNREVRIHVGRVAHVVLDVQPRVIYAGPDATAKVTIEVTDEAGNRLDTPAEEVTASSGAIGPFVANGDGTWSAVYRPAPGDQLREVRISARSGSATTDTVVTVEPGPIERGLSVSSGYISNFGEIGNVWLAVDHDIHLPYLPGLFLLRTGLAWYPDAAEVAEPIPDAPDSAQFRLSVLPATVGLAGRHDRGGRALWLGLGGVIAAWRVETRFGTELVSTRYGVFPPGLVLYGGAGQRVLSGELFVDGRGYVLASPGGNAVWQGPVGGVAIGLGYRLSY